jgi:hypothetical protein
MPSLTRRTLVKLLVTVPILSACGRASTQRSVLPTLTPRPRTPTPQTSEDPIFQTLDLFHSMEMLGAAMGASRIHTNVQRWRDSLKGVARQQSDDATLALESMTFNVVHRSAVYDLNEQHAIYTAESQTHADLWCMALIPIDNNVYRFGMFEGPTALLVGMVAQFLVTSNVKGAGREIRRALIPHYKNDDWDPPMVQPFDSDWDFSYPVRDGTVEVIHRTANQGQYPQQGEMQWRVPDTNRRREITIPYQNDTFLL